MLLALEVSQIPAFGHLARHAVKKYGLQKDERGCVVGQGQLKKRGFDHLFIVNQHVQF